MIKYDIPFGGMVSFQIFSQFPVDHLPRAVMSYIVLFLNQLVIFTYYAINHHITYTCDSIIQQLRIAIQNHNRV